MAAAAICSSPQNNDPASSESIPEASTSSSVFVSKESFKDFLEKSRSVTDHDVPCYDAVWLGYDTAKPIAVKALQNGSCLKEAEACLSLGLLKKEGTLGVLIPHASTGLCWEGAAADWLIAGLLKLTEACIVHLHDALLTLTLTLFHT